MEQSRLLTAPPWSPAGGRRVQSSVCGRRAQGLAGRTRRPGVAIAEGSGSSERRRRRVVAAVAARATCMHARERLPPSCSVRKHGFGGRSWFTDVLPPAEGLPGRRVDRRTRSLRRRTKIPRYARILIIFFSCGGMSCSCQWYRVCDAGALRAEPLATLMSCAVTIDGGDERSPKGNLQRRGPNTQYHVRIAPHRKPCQQFTYGYVRKSYIH